MMKLIFFVVIFFLGVLYTDGIQGCVIPLKPTSTNVLQLGSGGTGGKKKPNIIIFQ